MIRDGPVLTPVSVPSQDKQLSLMGWGRKIKKKEGLEQGRKNGGKKRGKNKIHP